MSEWKSGEWADVPSAQAEAAPLVNTKLSIVLPFIQSEEADVHVLLQRSLAISGQIPRTLFLLPFKGMDITEIKKLSEQAFSDIRVIQDSEGIKSDWNGQERIRGAAGPNSLFRQAAWFFYFNPQRPSWLWLEPDCWPMTPRWLFDLEREHFEVGKPFTGVKMKVADREYMNGVGIYPPNAVQVPELVQSTIWKQHPELEVGFDVAGGDEVLKRAHITKLIQLTGHLSNGDFPLFTTTVLCHGRTAFLGAHGAARDAQTEVLDEANSPPKTSSCVPSHELRTQELPQGGDPNGEKEKDEEERQGRGLRLTAPAPTFDPESASNYGEVSREIRDHINHLVLLWANHPHRKVLIVKELRKAKLVPKHFR